MVGTRASRLALLLLVALSGKATGVLVDSFSASGGESLALRGRGRTIPLFGGHDIIPENKEKRMMDMISKFRAETCARMHDEHGVKFESYEACLDFMTEACKPGKDKRMDGDNKEITSGEGFCNSFFPEAEKKAEKQIADEDAAAATAVAAAPSPAAAPPAAAPATTAAAPPPAEASEAPAEATSTEKTEAPAEASASEKTESGAGAGAGAAPAPGPAASPAAGPAGPFIPGKSAGKPPGPIAKDEKYYYKKNGEDMKRVHMDEGKKLPTQGYYGPLVEHNDQKTATQDWGKEWDKASYNAFCAKHPDNPWCEGLLHRHSTASSLTISVALLLVGIANFAA